jgi:predicted RNase H-like nuclease (RuvC/YqgF family)
MIERPLSYKVRHEAFKACNTELSALLHEAADKLYSQENEIAKLRERCKPSKVFEIGDEGHYVSKKVYDELTRQEKEIDQLQDALKQTLDHIENVENLDSFRWAAKGIGLNTCFRKLLKGEK